LYREAYFFDRIREGLAVPIPAGEQEVQFIYIGDLVESFVSGATSTEALGKAYNLTNDRPIIWKKLPATAMEVVDKEVELIEVDKATRKKFNLVPKDFFPFRNITFLLSINRLEEDNLSIPETDLKEELTRAYQWYLKENNSDFNHSIDKVGFILSKLK
jgi:nucleoside-diphosphate-sugar epimerase